VYSRAFSAASVCACVERASCVIACIYVGWVDVPRKRTIEICLLRIRKCVASSSITSCSWISTVAPLYFGGSVRIKTFFVILLESLWFFFVLHHQYLIATSCLFSFVFTGKGDSVFICFPSFGTSSIYIYIQIPHQTRQKSIKKITLLCGSVSSLLSVHQSLESLFNLFFFWRFVLYTIDFLRPAGGFLTLPSHFPAIMLCTPIDCTSSVLVTTTEHKK